MTLVRCEDLLLFLFTTSHSPEVRHICVVGKRRCIVEK